MAHSFRLPGEHCAGRLDLLPSNRRPENQALPVGLPNDFATLNDSELAPAQPVNLDETRQTEGEGHCFRPYAEG